MFDSKTLYSSAYTRSAPSLDPEIALALTWLDERLAAEKVLVVARTSESLRASAVLTSRAHEIEAISAEAFCHGYEWTGGRALALWPTEHLLEQLDSHPDVTALAVIPWRLADVEAWVRARQPCDLLALRQQDRSPAS